MRNLLLVLFSCGSGLISGCLASEPEYIGPSSEVNLSVTEEEEEEEIVNPPSSRVITIENNDMETGIPSSPAVDDPELCICDWEIVEQSSLVCLAVVCSDTCAPDEIPCGAHQRVCYPL